MIAAVWRTIPGHPRHQVSDQGDVLRDGRPPRLYSHRGYLLTSIDNRTYRVHRLVAMTFIGPLTPGLEVRHLNDVKHDNRVENLAIGTHSDNMRDRLRNGNDPNRRKTHCAHGHPYDSANTAESIVRGRPVRICIACRRDRVNRCAARRRARKAITA